MFDRKTLAYDLAMEIIFGTDSFNKDNLSDVIEKSGIDKRELERQTRDIIYANFAKGMQYDEEFLDKQFKYWLD